MSAALPDLNRRLRLLVVIASYGRKNDPFLKRVMQRYQSLTMDVDIFVLSEAPKDLGPGVRVVAGLPSANPWSLPFGHKRILAENVDRYDLFVYSEDDIEVTQRHIQAFLRVTPALSADEIAGFLRYETDSSGTRYVPEAHGSAHWKPETVKQRGAFTVAEFSNEHAGFYILTQSQLKQAIASGQFLCRPHEGRYGLPETAATDPYTQCGFRKVVCVSHLEDFLIHHMSNFYVNRHDLPLSVFKEQIETLINIRDGDHPASTLCRVESQLLHAKWSKNYYGRSNEDLLGVIPAGAKTILSIGSGLGNMEGALKQRGCHITTLPLNSVVGAALERQGIEVVYGTWDECLKTLGDRQFDCVCMKDLLHLQANPGQLVGQCSRLVKEGGTLILAGPNFSRTPWFVKRTFGLGEFRKLRSFSLGGISVCGPGTLAKHIQDAGLHVTTVRWLNHGIGWGGLRGSRIRFGRFTAKDWVLQARHDL